MKIKNIEKDENKFLIWGLVFAIGLYRFISQTLGQEELARNIFYGYAIGAALMILGKLVRRMK